MITTTAFTNFFIKRKAQPAEPIRLRATPSDGLVDIAIPILNEAAILATSIGKLHAYLSKQFPYQFRITIVDNGSSDPSWQIAQILSRQYPEVRAIRLERRGRGRALKKAWLGNDADILAYMDVDLSTDLSALEPLISPLMNGEAAIATGSRLHRQAKVVRSFKREFISRSYNYLLRLLVGFKTSDAQCGFKAIRSDIAQKLLPEVSDNEWFFDTELLVKAQRQKLNVHEVPVQWTEDTDSRVNIVKTAFDDLKGIRRLRAETRPVRSRRERGMIAGIVVVTAVLYTIGMLKNGYANSFYAAAVQAGTESWKAMFFGSIDASNYITVDKPPVALWLMELSTRVFGFHAWSMLLPNMLAGVGTVYLVYATVRRWFSSVSALLAAGVMALTPVAVLMFGFNNPDAALTILLTASMYAFVRAIDSQRPLLWVSLTGVFTGLAFNTKMLQGLIVLPALAFVYLLAAPHPFIKRVSHLLFAVIPTAVTTLAWPVIVSLFPVSSRPYIGSSSNNSIWDLIMGYNGFGRLLGRGSGQGAGGGIPGGTRMLTDGGGQTMTQVTPPTGMGGGRGPGGSGFGGDTGILRMFNSDFGPNIGWLLGAALLGAGLVVWLQRRAPRTDRTRLAVLAWTGWLALHIVVFSMVSGVIHPYYVVVMAPAVAALIGITMPTMLHAYKRGGNSAYVLPAAVALTSVVACVLLGYQANWLPWLRWLILAGGLISASGLVMQLMAPAQQFAKAMLVIAAVVVVLAPITYSLVTVTVSHTGSIPTAGPGATAMQGSNNENANAESALVSYLLENQGSATWIVAVASANESAAIQITSGQPVMAVGGFMGSDNALTVDQLRALVSAGKLRYYASSSGGMGSSGPGGGNSEILSWIQSNGKVVSYGGSGYTLYDLAQ